MAVHTMTLTIAADIKPVFSGARGNVLDTSTLAPAHGFILQGDAAGDELGISVSGAGDINGDRIDDLIVGAVHGDDGGGNAGEAYVIYGKAGTGSQFGTKVGDRQVLDTTNLAATDGFIIQGDARIDFLGSSVAGAGDVNGDGRDDLIVGANQFVEGGDKTGKAYIIYGKAGTGTQFGTRVGSRQVLDTTNLAPTDGFILQGDAAGDALGISVSGAGDINNDGYDDLIVGAYRGDGGGSHSGEAYIIYGKAGTAGTQFGTRVGRSQVLDTTNLAPTDGFILQGDAAGDWLGVSVSGAGDINGDGRDDLIVGALAGDDGGGNAGEAYIIYGKPGGTGSQFGTLVGGRQVLDTTNLAPADGFILQGDTIRDELGWSVSGAGDINGDGRDDLIVGAVLGDDGGLDAGEAYIIYGKAGSGSQFGTTIRGRQVLDTTHLAPADGFILQGDAADDRLGHTVSGAGDINGDGYDDLIVGARYGDDGGDDTGEAYILYGKAGTGSQFGTLVGGRQVLDTTGLSSTDGFILQGDVAGDELGESVSGAGDINNDGYDDLIVGARFGDDGGEDAGEAYIIYGGAHLGGAATRAEEPLPGVADELFFFG